MKTVTNKYGFKFNLPDQKYTKGEKLIASILDEAGIEYTTQFCYPDSKRNKFDIALTNGGVPYLFIEFDGEAHYSQEYFKNCGNGMSKDGTDRSGRWKVHVVKNNIADAKKDKIAWQHNVPILRLTKLNLPELRDMILSYAYVFSNYISSHNNEVVMIEMLEKYGWDFDYTKPSNPTQEEIKTIERMWHEVKCRKGVGEFVEGETYKRRYVKGTCHEVADGKGKTIFVDAYGNEDGADFLSDEDTASEYYGITFTFE